MFSLWQVFLCIKPNRVGNIKMNWRNSNPSSKQKTRSISWGILRHKSHGENTLEGTLNRNALFTAHMEWIIIHIPIFSSLLPSRRAERRRLAASPLQSASELLRLCLFSYYKDIESKSEKINFTLNLNDYHGILLSPQSGILQKERSISDVLLGLKKKIK